MKNINSTRLDIFISSLAKHPYLWAFAVCLALDPLCFGSMGNIPNNSFMIFFLAGLFTGIMLLGKNKLARAESIVVFSALFLFVYSYRHLEKKATVILFYSFFALALCYIFLDSKKHKEQKNSLLIMSGGFALKLFYVLTTSVYQRQNDVGVFGEVYGHAGYMEHLLNNHNLPDTDVRLTWQYCHPPLHHTICALWIHISENIFMTGHDQARESLQMLTLFYSMCIMISAYKLLKRFKLKGIALYAPLAIVSFHPAFVMLSGSINNDVLSIALMLGAVVCAFNWKDDPSMKNILKTALCMGLAMMTKLAAAIAAPAIAVIFLTVFFKNIKKDGKKIFGQFVAFGAVCAPLGLWFEIRNYIKWKVPIMYVQEMDPTAEQYLGTGNFLKRITDFSSGQFQNVFEQWRWHDENGSYGYNEFNPLTALFKTSVFGESMWGSWVDRNSNVYSLCEILFAAALILALFAFVCMIFMIFRKCEMKKLDKAFFIVLYLSLMGNFYKMAHDYPFTCTMNFRYITPTVIIGALFVGLFTHDMLGSVRSERAKAVIKAAVTVPTLTFAAASVLTWCKLCQV